MNFTLAQLEALLWVARLGSIRAASSRLSISQPALTRRVQELEGALAGRLLNRDGYRVTLTTLGLEVTRHAESIITIAERLNDRVAPSSEVKGLIRLGATDSFASRDLPRWLVNFKEAHPEAEIELVVEFSANLYEKLLKGDLDIAILTGVKPSPLLESELLKPLPLYWVGAPSLLGAQTTATPEALFELPIISNPAPSLLFDTIEAWFSSAGLTLNSYSSCTSLFIAKALACAGAGVSLLPNELIEEEISSGALRILKSTPPIPPHQMFISYRRDAPRKNLRVVADHLRKFEMGI